MIERRTQRQEAVQERREQHNNPDVIKERVWWNSEEIILDLNLSSTQRKQADTLLVSFLEQRASLEATGLIKQREFFEALGSGDKSTQARKRAMVEALSASTLASADFRIAVLETLTIEQRTALSETRVRLLRSNWTRLSSPREGMQRPPRY